MGRRGRARGNERRHRQAIRWAAIGAIAAVIAIPVTLLIALSDDDEPTQVSSPATTEGPAPSARLVIKQEPENATFPVGPEQLPTPPSYVPDPGQQQESHCREWEAWLREQRAAMASNPTISVSAPAEAAVSITAVRPIVHRAEQPRETSFVQCHEGAGGYDPTYLQLDLERPHARPVLFEEQKGGEIGPLPDAVFTVAPGRTESLALQDRGRAATFYEWTAEVDVVVDQVEKTVTLGSKDKPLRSWFGDFPEAVVDYDMNTRSWQPVG